MTTASDELDAQQTVPCHGCRTPVLEHTATMLVTDVDLGGGRLKPVSVLLCLDCTANVLAAEGL